jgi:hypothetical protein
MLTSKYTTMWAAGDMEQKIRIAPADPGPHIGSMRDIKK